MLFRSTVEPDAAEVRGMDARTKESIAARDGSVIPRARGDRSAPLLAAQTRLWFLDRLEPGNPTYNIAIGLRLRAVSDRNGEPVGLDEDALRRALDEIVRRHEILRTIFQSGDEGPRQMSQPPRPFDLDIVDLGGLSGEEQAADRKSTRLNSSHVSESRMPSSA